MLHDILLVLAAFLFAWALGHVLDSWLDRFFADESKLKRVNRPPRADDVKPCPKKTKVLS